MDRDRDRGGRQVKRPKTSSSSDSRQHSHSHNRDARVEEEKVKSSAVHEEEKISQISKKDVYEKITAYELEEARNLDHEKVFEKYSSILSKFEENVAEVFALKLGHGNSTPERKALLRLEGLGCATNLRTINRLMKFKLKNVKDEQLQQRQKVDAEHLLLQNLLYEATNLQNQVSAVQDYKGMDEKIDLIPVEQFYKEAPERVSKPEVTKNDPHLLRIARLEYEFTQRQKLTEQCATLEKEKETVTRNIEEKQAKLDSVRPLLSKVLESTLPLQDFFGLDISAKRVRNETARYLPSPLYVLFVQSEAYQESEGKHHFGISIGGDVDAAKEIMFTQEEIEEDSDSEKNQDVDADVSERRILRKRSSMGMSLDDNRKRTFQKHPLWIEWMVKTKGGESVSIQFYYLTKLKIVTVKSRVHRDATDGTTSFSIFGNSDSVLNELFTNDTGMSSPNPANGFIFNKFGISSLGIYLKDTGHPYVWAQKLCGLEFPEQIPNGESIEVRSNMDVSCRNIEGTLRQIRKRLVSQARLWRQLKALESRNIQIPAAAKELFPQKNSTTFVSWDTIDFETFKKAGFTEPIISCEGTSLKDMYFKAVLQRGRAKMIAFVAVKIDFPTVAPVFCIQLDMDGEFRNAMTDATIREIEKEVNVYLPKECGEWSDVLISLQLHRLTACCDIILETDVMMRETAGPSEFVKEKLFIRITQGRNLRRPFQFVNEGGGYFTQRF